MSSIGGREGTIKRFLGMMVCPYKMPWEKVWSRGVFRSAEVVSSVTAESGTSLTVRGAIVVASFPLLNLTPHCLRITI